MCRPGERQGSARKDGDLRRSAGEHASGFDTGPDLAREVYKRLDAAESRRRYKDKRRSTGHDGYQVEPPECEATLVAVAKRLRQLGKDANEAERSRVMCLSRLGQLLGPGKPGRPKTLEDHNIKTLDNNNVLSAAERQRRHQARLFAEHGDRANSQAEGGA